jgi:hypothetical protein
MRRKQLWFLRLPGTLRYVSESDWETRPRQTKGELCGGADDQSVAVLLSGTEVLSDHAERRALTVWGNGDVAVDPAAAIAGVELMLPEETITPELAEEAIGRLQTMLFHRVSPVVVS